MSEDILLETASVRDYHDALKRWADLLVKMRLAGRYGVYAERIPVGGMGIYLGRHESLQAS